MKFSEQVKLAKSTKQIHSTWYRETYPEVAELGLDPATHYVRYGAEMGRNPGKNFNTQFYLDTYPEVKKSKLNPLVHYALHGQKAGYATRPQREDPRKQVNVIRTKLLSLGFTERPLAELTEIANTSDNPEARAMAARELALWHMRAKTETDYRTALDWIVRARPDAPDLDFRAKLSTVELLCHYHLGNHAAGLAAYEHGTMAGEATPDLILARVNYEKMPERRVLWINQVLACNGIEPVTLLPDAGQTAYDRLTCAVDLQKVTEGPKVTVLIAAYDAADMLPTALRSLKEQTWTNLEIIVLDDCSPSMDTMRVAEGYAATDPRIQVVRMAENGGAYVARNHGLYMATGEFVTLHDADDWSHPKKIETQVRFMMENPEVMGCTSEQTRINEDLSIFTLRGQNLRFMMFNTSSLLWRRDPVTEALGYWDNVRFGADTEFLRRIQRAFGKHTIVHVATGILSMQRQSATSVTLDPVMGIDTYLYGVRREYQEAQLHHHDSSLSIKYSLDLKARPFPVPVMMLPNRLEKLAEKRHFDSIIYCDLRPGNKYIEWAIETLKAEIENGMRVGLIGYECLNDSLSPMTVAHEIRTLIDGDQVVMLVYGDDVTCTREKLAHPKIKETHKRLTARVTQIQGL